MSEHQIVIGDERIKLDLIRDNTGKVMYEVTSQIPQYRDPLLFIQNNWIGGHGQYEFAQPDMYFEGQSIDTTQENRIILGPLINEVYVGASTEMDSTPTCFFWSAVLGKWLCADTNHVYVFGTNWVETATTKDITGVVGFADFNGYVFAARGQGAAYVYSSDGATWTTCTLTDHHANGFFTAPNAAGTANVLWKFGAATATPTKINELKSHTTGINDTTQWGSAAYIGDTSNDITNIFLINDNLMVGKTDNLYHYDSDGGLHPLMDDLKHNRSTQNFKYVTQWQTGTYFSLIRGMGEITSYNAYEPMGPLSNIDDIGRIGDIVGLTSDKDWVYAAIDDGTYHYIYKGREVRRAGGLRWEWCPWVYLGTNACTTAKVCQHTATDRRLWFGYGTHTAYVILSDNPTADSAARFAPSGWLRMSYVYGTNKYWDKLWQSIITETKGCTTNRTVTTKYRKDTETTATTISGVVTKNGMRQTYFANPLDCKRIQFEIWLATNSSSSTPEVLHFEARGVERPTVVRIHEAVYVIGDEPSNKAKTLRNKLRDARESTTLIKFTDLRYGGSDYVWVVMEPGYPQEIEITHEKGRQPELGLRVRFREVDYPTS